jgi:ribonucleoside-diphosphate reductase alpha chain
MEAIAYTAYAASADLAEERGPYSTFKGSLWDKGVFPHESLKLLAEQRGGYVEADLSTTLDWESLRKRIKLVGMRNSNCIAIAPTATIANITGLSQCIEPTYQNLYVKSNLSGEFTVANEYLVADLKRLNLWDEVMISDLKYFDGTLAKIDRIPAEVRSLYATAFEVEPKWLVECAARRQKWIDQSQSLNIYMAGASGKKLDETYKLAWLRGLKTTYYLRTQSATAAEKSTVKSSQLNAVSNGGRVALASGAAVPAAPSAASVASDADVASEVKFCALDNPECEACQ